MVTLIKISSNKQCLLSQKHQTNNSRISGQSLEDSATVSNNGHYYWSPLKTFSYGELRGNLQNAWCGVVKELEDSMARQHNDRSGLAFQRQIAICDLPQSFNETSIQEELLYMSR